MAQINDNSNLYKFTPAEKLKLLRNMLIFLLLDIVIIVLFTYLFILYHKMDWLSGLVSILVLSIVSAILLSFLNYWRDYQTGEAVIFSGYVEKKERIDHAEYPTAFFINLDGREHQISAKYYYRIQDHDYVVIRKAPRTHYTLGVEIKNGK